MKFKPRLFRVSLALGVLAWLLDAGIDAFVFRLGTFPDLALLAVPPTALVFRAFVIVLFLAFGFVVSQVYYRQEIKEQEVSLRALEASERKFRELAELLPEPVFEADLDFRVTYANQKAFELFGYTPEELEAGLSGLEMMVPEDREKAIASLEKRVGGIDPGVMEYTARRKDGSTFPMLFHASLAMDEEGRPVNIRGLVVDITHRKLAEEGLRESERRFRSIVEASPMGVFLYELEESGRLILRGANTAADQILGIPTTPLMGKSIEEAFPALVGTEVPDRYREVAATGGSWHTGDLPYSQGDISGLYDVFAFQTAPNEMALMFLDVTENRAAEEALRESEERLRLAARSGRVGIWEYEIATDRLEWDDLMYELHGVEKAGAGDGIQRWRDCCHPDDLEWAEGQFRESLAVGGRPFDTQFRVIRQDDLEVRYIRGLAGVFRDPEGTPVRVLGTNWDITPSKKIEAALRDSEARFRSVIEQQNDATYILFEGRFDLVNPRFTELTGVSPEEAAAPEFDFWELIAPGSVPVIRERQEQRDRGEEVPGIYEFEIKHRDGHLVQVEASVTEIEYREGTAVLGLLRDITEQTSLKEQLLLAQKMESVGRLSGGVAHDLNNLLTPIIGYGDLMLGEFSPEDERKDSVQEILEAAHRAKDLVHQLLAFSRQQAMEFRAIDLNEMVRTFRRLLRRTIREDVEIRFLPSPTSPVIRGDRGQLEQVIMNLAVNAQDAMPEGGILSMETSEVHLDREFAETRSGVTPGHYAMLSFSDTGFGMDEETRDRIFEPFFTTKEMGKGTGLGLATAYGIIKQHEGNIWVYSEEGEGTSFRVYLPLANRPVIEMTTPQSVPAGMGGSETILVVEDEERVRKLAVRVLKQQGYSVMEAADGPSCLDSLEGYEGPLDLLLTDVVMPGMNGRELFRELRKSFPDARALYMSGYTEDIISHKGVLDEGIPFIQKPFTVHTLTTRIRAVLEDE